MEPKTIIDALGGIQKTAEIADCSIQAVYKWVRLGVIPKRSLTLLQARRPKVFRELAAREDHPKAAA